MSPTARNGRRNRRGGPASSMYTMSRQSTKLPETLPEKIADGTPDPAGEAADSRDRARPPIPPPTAIAARSAAPGPDLVCGGLTRRLVTLSVPVFGNRPPSAVAAIRHLG